MGEREGEWGNGEGMFIHGMRPASRRIAHEVWIVEKR
jgi:hypothetical protein